VNTNRLAQVMDFLAMCHKSRWGLLEIVQECAPSRTAIVRSLLMVFKGGYPLREGEEGGNKNPSTYSNEESEPRGYDVHELTRLLP